MSAIDPVLLNIAAQIVRLGDVVWDIGANVGLFSFAAAAMAGPRGKVFSFEPDAWLVQLLRNSARDQTASIAPVTVIPVAVASDISLRTFLIARRSRAANALLGYGSKQADAVDEQQTVPAYSVDWLLERLPAPNVLKIDVEGAEVEVLAQQKELFTAARPLIFCEVSAENSPEITRILKAADYRLYDARLTGYRATDTATWNTLAVPADKLSIYSALDRDSQHCR